MKLHLSLIVSLMIISFSSIEFAQAYNLPKKTHKYKCYAAIDAHIVFLTVNLNNLDDKIRVQKNLADFDRNHIGRNNNEKRFVFEESDEGVTEVLLTTDLLNGAQQGLMIIQTHGEDNTRAGFNCYLIN